MTSLFWKLPKNADELIESVKWSVGGALSLEVKAPGTVTTNLLKQRNSGALQIRLDNYNMAGNPRLENIPIRLRAPSAGVRQVTVFSSDRHEPLSLEFVIRERTLEFSLPSLEVYSLVEVRES